MMTLLFLLLLMSVMLFNCQSMDRDTKSRVLTLSNVAVQEVSDALSQHHEILVSFDYVFIKPAPQENAYFCTIQFVGKDQGHSFSTSNARSTPCHIVSGSGSSSFRSPSPMDNSVQDPNMLINLKLPVQFFVAVHQRTTQGKSAIIARSKTFQSTK